MAAAGARLLKRLLRGDCHRGNKSEAKPWAEADRRAGREWYRTILPQGGRERPAIPPRPKGNRGRIAQSASHNLHGHLGTHEKAVLRFMGDPGQLTDKAGERTLRMAKVKSKVAGGFRTRHHADA